MAMQGIRLETQTETCKAFRQHDFERLFQHGRRYLEVLTLAPWDGQNSALSVSFTQLMKIFILWTHAPQRIGSLSVT
jgi:hypothetical protein